ncbi:MAG: DUF922 domain-containing Zn-dependent protease, partial [Cyanobacteria bacterium P01_G01_bin.67]
NKAIFKFLIFCSFLPISSPVLSEPSVTTKFKFYDIYPQTKSDLGKEMYARTPIVYQGKKYDGYTSWYVNWRFGWRQKNGLCKISSVNTKLDIGYTMPRLPQQYQVDSTVRNAFDRYYSVLFEHEQGHKDSGLYAAREIERELKSLGSFHNCQKLETAANQKAHKIIKKYNERDRNYDLQTQHGRLQGVDLNNFIN